MNNKSWLPEAFEKEKKNEREWAELIAPLRRILDILFVVEILIVLIGIVLIILLFALGNGQSLIQGIITIVIVCGAGVLVCYVAELRCHAQINHLSVEYQQRNLLKKLAVKDKKPVKQPIETDSSDGNDDEQE